MKKLLVLSCFVTLFSSCTVSRNSMREANYQLWLHHEDIEYSPQFSGEAVQTKILFIDWERLFGKRKFEYGAFGDLPSDPFQPNISGTVGAIGGAADGNTTGAITATINGIIGITNVSRVEQMAMYDMIRKNPGYDMVLFPQFTSQRRWFGIGSTTTVSCRAKLGKLKETRP